jgi:seryl-tRNA synthetase
MIDISFIRNNVDLVKQAAVNKRVAVDIDELLAADATRRELQTKIGALKQRKNELARAAAGSRPSAKQIAAGKAVKNKLATLEHELQAATERFTHLLEHVPNIPSADTPVGPDESANQIIRTVGDKPAFNFTPKPHWELGQALGVIDSERAAEVTGSRFTYLKGELVMLEFALISFALSILTSSQKLQEIAAGAEVQTTDKPFMPVIPPVMIRPEIMQKMARLEPAEDRYYIPSDNLYLVGSAEHTLGPMHMGEVLTSETLPLRYVGFSTAFRREAGSHGRDVRGILRLHQFDKLEIESFTAPEHSQAEQDFIVAIQEYLMQQLAIPYQVVLKCTADMGAPNHRAVDIESWLPGQNMYRETHTSDHMSDYQARRLHTKVKQPGGEAVYVHMNDATVFAIGRTLIALMENHQQADGSIAVPAILHPHLPFTSIPAV